MSLVSSSSAVKNPSLLEKEDSRSVLSDFERMQLDLIDQRKLLNTRQRFAARFMPIKTTDIAARTSSAALPKDIQKLINQGNDRAALEKLLKIANPTAEEHYQIARYYEWGSFKKGKMSIGLVSFEQAYQNYFAAAKAGHQKAIQKLQFWGFMEGGKEYNHPDVEVDSHIEDMTLMECVCETMVASQQVIETESQDTQNHNARAYILLTNCLSLIAKKGSANKTQAKLFELTLKSRLSIVLDLGFKIGSKSFLNYERAKEYYIQVAIPDTSNLMYQTSAKVEIFCQLNINAQRQGALLVRLAYMCLAGKVTSGSKANAADSVVGSPAPLTIDFDGAYLYYQIAIRKGFVEAATDMLYLLDSGRVSSRLYPAQDMGKAFIESLTGENFKFYKTFLMAEFYCRREKWKELCEIFTNIPVTAELIKVYFLDYSSLISHVGIHYDTQPQYNEQFVTKAEEIIRLARLVAPHNLANNTVLNENASMLHKYRFKFKNNAADFKRARELMRENSTIDKTITTLSSSSYLSSGRFLRQPKFCEQKFSRDEREEILKEEIGYYQKALKNLPESNHPYYRAMRTQIHELMGDACHNLADLQSDLEKTTEYATSSILSHQKAVDLGSVYSRCALFRYYYTSLKAPAPPISEVEIRKVYKKFYESMMMQYEAIEIQGTSSYMAYLIATLHETHNDLYLSRDEAIKFSLRASKANHQPAKSLFLEWTFSLTDAEVFARYEITQETRAAWYQESADLGEPWGLIYIAHQKLNTANNLESSSDSRLLSLEAIDYYQKALEKDPKNKQARKALFHFAARGEYCGLEGQKPNYAKVIELLKPLANEGDSNANLALFILCEQGILSEASQSYFDRVQNYTTEAYHKARIILGIEAEVFEYTPFENSVKSPETQISLPAKAPERILTLGEELEVAQDFYAKRLKPEDLKMLFSLTLSKEIQGEDLMRMLTKLGWTCSDLDNKYMFKAPRGLVFGTHRKHNKDQGVVDIQFVKDIRNYLISLALDAPESKSASRSEDDDGDA